jgi:YVTN family beta-propeller protein
MSSPVAAIQLATRTVRTLRAPDTEWFGVIGAVATAGNRVLATSWRQRRSNESVNDGPGLLHVLDAATLADVAPPVPVGVQPRSIAWHPSRNKAYIVNYGLASASCTVVDLATGTGTDIPLGATPVSVAVDAEADRAYVALGLQNAVAVIDTAADQILQKVKVGANPNFLTVEEGTGTVFSLAQPLPGSPTSGTIVVLERSLAVRTMILPAGRRSNFAIVVPPGGPVYVGNLDWVGELDPGVLVVDRDSGAQLAMSSPGNVRGLALDPAVPSLWAATDGATRLYDVTEVGAIAQAPPLVTGPVPWAVAVGSDGIGYVGDRRDGTVTAVESTVVPPPPPPGFAVAMHSGRMNVFVQRPDGRLETARWAEEDGWSRFARLGLTIPQNAPAAALSRRPDEWDLFVVDETGRLLANSGTGITRGAWTELDTGLPPCASVTAISWDPGATLVFTVGPDGVVRSYGWNGTAVTGTARHEGQQFHPGAPIVAVTRKRGHWDLFVLHPDGTVWSQWWSTDEDGFSAWGRGPHGVNFAPGTRLTAIGRHSKALDLFAVDRLGQVRTAFWHSEDGWSAWGLPAPDGPHCRPGGTVAAYPKKGDNIDVLAVGDDLQLWTVFWDDGWSGWLPLGAAVDRVDAPVALTGRGFEELDVVWLGPADEVQHSWWNRWQGNWAHLLAAPRSVVGHSRFFFDDVRSGDLLRGNVKVTLWPDGVYYLRGRMRNQAVAGVEFEVQAAVLANAGQHTNSDVALTINKRGDADGWDPFGDEDRVFDWAEVGTSRAVQMYYGGTATGTFQTRANHENVGLGGALGDLVDGVIGGFLNALVDNPVTETMIMGLAIGRELEGLVGLDLEGVGGLAGLIAVGPAALWLVAGSVIIPMAVGELPFGVRHRTMEQFEWDWAARVFGISLPPKEQIEITNMRGLGNKSFVSVKTSIFPGGDPTYYVHLGDQAYDSPITDLNEGRPVPGQLFIHELTHVWDAAHSGPDWLLNSICENRNPPRPPADTPWVLLTTEEKAVIVETWFLDHEGELDSPAAFSDDYFHYIDENIRKGTNQ